MIKSRQFLQTGFLFVSMVFFAAASAETQSLGDKLGKALKASRLKANEVGAQVLLLKNGATEIIWEARPNESMIPASLTKIITAGAVLHGLGPSRKLETKLWTTGAVKGSELEGDLILQGGGDPGFVSETMWVLVNEFTRTGIRAVRGNVIVDSSRFDQVHTDPSRQSERVDRAFDAPVSAMSFNWNSVNVFVRPASKAGESAKVVLDPETDEVTLQGLVKTVAAGQKTDVQVERKTGAKGQDVIVVNGKIGVGSKEFVAYKNISSPERWSGRALISFLKQRGVVVNGDVKQGVVPASATLAARAESKPVADMTKDMMKFSNNFVAEMLVKNLAAETHGSPASLATGVNDLKEYVVRAGVPKDRFLVLNPSGFSRENRFTAAGVTQVLLGMREEFGIFAEALASFPVAGTDGTLRSRMKKSAAEGRVRAKTGLLNGVVGLAGFAGRDDGSQLTFVFMYNGRTGFAEDARAVFDQMAALLVQ